jgi:hypothetical protein
LECSGSKIILAFGSEKTVWASLKDILCFLRFNSAFLPSQTNDIDYIMLFQLFQRYIASCFFVERWAELAGDTKLNSLGFSVTQFSPDSQHCGQTTS